MERKQFPTKNYYTIDYMHGQRSLHFHTLFNTLGFCRAHA